MATLAAMLAVLAVPGLAAAAAPPPCGGQAQISDADGDGHHAPTDVLAAWYSESSGHLQGVIKVKTGTWAPDHEDGAAGYALLFSVGGQIRFVRAEATGLSPIRFDHGTWTEAGGFVSAGPTTGEVVSGPGGTATIDIPAQTGAISGALLANSFVLTYDGIDATGYHWVDRAPGSVTPSGSEYGADYIVGSCGSGPSPGGGPGGGGGVGAGAVSSVKLRAPTKRVGKGRVRIRGSIAPARAGVPVELHVTARRNVIRRLTTRADGTFSALVRLTETTRLRAVVGGIRSQTLTVTMFSKTRIKIRRLRGGGVLVRGSVSPSLSGRVLWLRTTAIRASARTSARKGRFRFRFNHLPRGRYEAVFIPSKGRAERSTSNRGVIK